ncbi:MAG TPA: translational GTPase TypA [Phaeodactylibacter sp.]|nr:translational GTPase TypA [Phaeodactylibacter sp.]
MGSLRNIAIIAHVDHGKTTLVDKILHQCNLFRENEEKGELILDNNDLERERGITIVSKNVSVVYKDVKINIIDTPGHADFGGEVERVLNMADGVLLIVDAFEGPMPQTRYVLSKAIALGLKPIVVINKVDKENCRPEEVQEDVFDLMCNLEATEEQLDFATIYGSAKNGWMGEDWEHPADDVTYLLDQVLAHIPEPKVEEGTLQMQITSIDYSSYIGRIGIGRVTRGVIKANSPISLVKRDGSITKGRIKELYSFAGLGKVKVSELHAGDICAISGIEGFDIGDTIADFENPEGLTPISIDEPTMSMFFTINTSPFFGKEGDYVTSRHLRDRLFKETEKNLALRVEETDSPDAYNVYGRGIMHLSVLIETMRREGYELAVGKPRVIIKEINGVKCEPIELLSIDLPDSVSGKVIEAVTMRKGEMTIMEPKGDLMHLEFEIPSRGIIGLRNQILTLTAGEAIMSHRFLKYDAWKGDLPSRNKGVLIAHETGTSIPFALFKLQERGKFFIPPGVDVYEGQIVGENTRENDICVNVIKTKKMSNMRSSGADDKVKIAPHVQMSLEQYMEYLGEDEYLELTPKSMRLRKIYLKEHERKRANNSKLVM